MPRFTNRKILTYVAGGLILYILYKLFFEGKSAASNFVASGAGQVGQSGSNVTTFKGVVDDPSTDPVLSAQYDLANNPLPYGPPAPDAKPPDGLFGPVLPDGGFYPTT